MSRSIWTSLLGCACIAALGCTTPSPEAETVMEEPVDCRTAKQDIALLEGEKASNAERVAQGVTSVAPPAVVTKLLRGKYKQGVEKATGDYNDDLEAKIAQIKQQCGMWP